MSGEVQILAPDGVPEIQPGDDLAAVVSETITLEDGDIVVITSKGVSKAEGRLYDGDRALTLAAQTSRVVARAGDTTIVRSVLGLTMAAAGIDESNVEPGRFALLPIDPDASARRLRTGVGHLTGRNVAVVISDTAGRAWRVGQTDLAIGAAGLRVVEDLRGHDDSFGTPLRVTLPAVADELASAAELAAGKLNGRPVVRIRGRSDLVLDPRDDGAGANALIRATEDDLFGYGAREAVVAAWRGGDPRPFGRPASAIELAAALRDTVSAEILDQHPDHVLACSAEGTRGMTAVAFAHGWVRVKGDDSTAGVSAKCLRFQVFTPSVEDCSGARTDNHPTG